MYVTFKLPWFTNLNLSTTVFGTTYLSTWYLGQILVTIGKLFILHIVAFIPLEIAKLLPSNF